jgi:hypothetical protein
MVELKDIAPHRQRPTPSGQGRDSILSNLLATTVSPRRRKGGKSPWQIAAADTPGFRFLSEELLAASPSLATKAGQEKRNWSHQESSILPLAASADQENLQILASSKTDKILRQIFIDEDGLAFSPAQLWHEEPT